MLTKVTLIFATSLFVANAAPQNYYTEETTATASYWDPEATGYASSSSSAWASSSEWASSSTWESASTSSAWSAASSSTTSSSSVASSTPSATATSSSSAASSTGSLSAVHRVTVGGGPLTYQPSFVTANVGDIVLFTFKQANHTLTQSSFPEPCKHLADASGAPIGLDSGFVPVAANATEFPDWALTVSVTTPLWFYCRQANHCQQGMVFAVNPPATGNTFDAFLAKAKNVSAPTATWTETASAKWTGSGMAAASSTGVLFPTVLGANAPTSTTPPSSSAGKVVVSLGLSLVATIFATLM